MPRARRSTRSREEQGFSGGNSPAGAALSLPAPRAAARLLRHELRAVPLRGLPDGKRARGDEARAAVHPRRRDRDRPARAATRRLYKTEPRITGSPTLLVSDYITQNLALLSEAAGPRGPARRAAKRWPTRRRRSSSACSPSTSTPAATDSTPGCSALVERAAASRCGPPAADGTAATQTGGCYLGAYAWVEDLRPAHEHLEPVQLPAKRSSRRSQRPTPLMHDSGNGGYIHAPSLTHARTAAVLRSGYLANATSANPGHAVGQPVLRPGARGPVAPRRHPQRAEPRRAAGLPLRARPARRLRPRRSRQVHLPAAQGIPARRRLARLDRRPQPNVPIEAIEASNVLDGRKLADQIRESGDTRATRSATAGLPAATRRRGGRDRRHRRTRCLNAYDAIARPRARRGRASGRARELRPRRRDARCLLQRHLSPGPRSRPDPRVRDRADAPRRDPAQAWA